MRHPIPTGVFIQKPTTGEKKSELTNRASQQILDSEKSVREAKTRRLRLARLAKEQAQPAAAPAKTGSGKRKAAGLK